ncbi:MAG: hypothetical protein JO076_15205 [Verrucomicrobia bacterium]|nr:hypothetical protein [Verrucomicrobiota bacterium]
MSTSNRQPNMFKGFPDRSPSGVLSLTDVDPLEYQRALWLWQRRPSETSVLLLFLVFGIGALAHIPFILRDDMVPLAAFHSFYVLALGISVSRFIWREAEFRRWKRDYLHTLARLSVGNRQTE